MHNPRRVLQLIDMSDQSSRGAAPIPHWHALAAHELAVQLEVDVGAGLPADEVLRRLKRHGANAIEEKPPRPPWRMLLDQFADFMILVLIAAAVISGLIGDIKDTLVIMVIVLLNALIGFVQEMRAEQAMTALKKMAATSALVRRAGERISVAAAELVPGDVVLLEAGNVVPADLRLVEAVRLRVDEALLTGEATTVDKCAEALAGAALPLAERRNMAYKGTTATYGRGIGLVVGTGMATELGKIATLIEGGEQVRTPLQKRLDVFGRRLGFAVLAICAIFFAAGLLPG